jgi:hypothetical protein
VCLLLAAASVAIEIPWAIHTLDRSARHSASLNFDDREKATGNSIYPNTGLLDEAAGWIPRKGTYRVVTGSLPVKDATSLTRLYAGVYAAYFLLPRRPSPTSAWVICLGCDPSNLGATNHVVWTDNQGSSLLRVGTS